jgi:hypothetical protein
MTSACSATWSSRLETRHASISAVFLPFSCSVEFLSFCNNLVSDYAKPDIVSDTLSSLIPADGMFVRTVLVETSFDWLKGKSFFFIWAHSFNDIQFRRRTLIQWHASTLIQWHSKSVFILIHTSLCSSESSLIVHWSPVYFPSFHKCSTNILVPI